MKNKLIRICFQTSCAAVEKKKEILSSLKIDYQNLSQSLQLLLNIRISLNNLDHPGEVANSFLGEYSSTQLHNLVKRKKIKHFCIIAACILIFAALVIYSFLKIQQLHWLQNGYIIQVTYPGTDPHLDELDVTIFQTY